MRPDEYEHIVAEHFETKGYKTTVNKIKTVPNNG